MFPLALCTVAGLTWLRAELARVLPQRLAWAAVIALIVPHLVIGLGHFSATSIDNALRWQARFETHDGPMWTGAYLYKTYFQPGFLTRSIRNDGFGRSMQVARGLDAALADAAAGRLAGRTVVVIFGSWNGHAYYYHAQAAGARRVSRRPGPNFDVETHMTLGGAQLISFFITGPHYAPLERLPVAAGDELWIVTAPNALASGLSAKIPPGLTVAPVGSSSARWMQRYRFVARAPAGVATR
jgi:hypothetical protein